MFVIAFLIATLGYAVGTLLLIRVVFSMLSRNEESPIYRFTFQVTEPLLAPVRKLAPSGHTAGLDLSPAIVGLGLIIVIALASKLS